MKFFDFIGFEVSFRTYDEISDFFWQSHRHPSPGKSGQYNEMQLRQEFLDPFFEALGWDMTNKAGYAEAYKDVIHEDAIKIGGKTKVPDYRLTNRTVRLLLQYLELIPKSLFPCQFL